MTFRAGESGNPKGRPKGKNGIAALAAKATPENIRWLQNVRDSRAPWPIRMKAVERLLAYAHGRPRETIHSRGDTPGRAASASVVIYTAEASFVANDGADIPQVLLLANGYEIDPETRQPMFPELADDPDEGEKLLAYAGMELPTKPVAETAPIAAAETPIKKIRGRVPKKGKNDIAALAAKSTPENIRWLQNVRDSRAPWPIRMKAVELLLAYAHGRPRKTIHSGGNTPGQAASASVVIHTKQEKASFADDGADITQVRLPANGYEIDPETRQPMFPELAGDPDEGEKLLKLAYAGMELPTKPVAETAPIAAAETPIKKIRGRVLKKGKNGIAALAAKATPKNIRWLQNVRDSRAPWPLRMKAVELLLAYARGRPWETIPSRGDTPGRAASASVVNYTKQEKASFVANDGADITQVQLPANGYEIDPETRQPMFPELADDPDEGEKLLELAYAGMELPTKPVAETAPIAAAETPIKKIGGPVPKQKQAEPPQRVPSDIFDPTTNINPVDSMEAVVEPGKGVTWRRKATTMTEDSR